MDLEVEDFRSVRNVLRFAAAGIPAAPEVAGRAVELIAPHTKNMADVGSLLERIRSGILPAQESCFKAERQLARFFDGQQDQDAHVQAPQYPN